MSTAQDLPVGEVARPYGAPVAGPALRLVPAEPLDFDDAVRRVRPRLQRYAVRRLGDPHEAEELVQEALLRAYTHREQLLTEDDLSAWTTVVTGRLVIDRLRVRGRSVLVADVPEGSRVGRDTADLVVARDEARTALDVLDAMPPRQAALLWAREVEGRSYDDLCDRFAMTEPAVRSVLTRARKALRKEYAVRGGTLPLGGLAVLAPWATALGCAGRLRRVAARLTTPAALGAVGITALTCLVLSPFDAPSAPSGTTYSPSDAVVTTPARQPAAAARHVRPAPPHVTQSRVEAARRPAAEPSRRARQTILPGQDVCLATTTQDNRSRYLSLGGISLSPRKGPAAEPSKNGVGSSHCATSTAVPANALYPGIELPANPTGIRGLSIVSSDLACSPIPNQPLIACGPETNPAGSTP
ncbi:MAG: sigma-70 family polymerase sigma factor [Frankiales bacterium]|nr:sigma-70 family polymerase sigma factor [Frankiales bacterium]